MYTDNKCNLSILNDLNLKPHVLLYILFCVFIAKKPFIIYNIKDKIISFYYQIETSLRVVLILFRRLYAKSGCIDF